MVPSVGGWQAVAGNGLLTAESQSWLKNITFPVLTSLKLFQFEFFLASYNWMLDLTLLLFCFKKMSYIRNVFYS